MSIKEKKIETTECFRVFYKAQLSSCLYRICKKSQNVRIKNKSVHDQCTLLKCDQLYSCKKNIPNIIMKLYFIYIFLSNQYRSLYIYSYRDTQKIIYCDVDCLIKYLRIYFNIIMIIIIINNYFLKLR